MGHFRVPLLQGQNGPQIGDFTKDEGAFQTGKETEKRSWSNPELQLAMSTLNECT